PQLAHMRDVEEPGGGAGMAMLGDDAGRIMQRHRVAGERHHPGAERLVQSIERRLPQRRRDGQGHRRASDRADACASDSPPLSWTLRDSPEPARTAPAPAYSVGERPASEEPAAAFQSALPPTVLLPESFRGGCSFGAATLAYAEARSLLRACDR